MDLLQINKPMFKKYVSQIFCTFEQANSYQKSQAYSVAWEFSGPTKKRGTYEWPKVQNNNKK
jgi:hypothetical protein